jgi:hypothetical protein
VLKERRFRAYRVDGSHLADSKYRARLEAMKPGEIRQYLARATDAAIADYLQRVLKFDIERCALEQAPTGERRSVTFIMGEDRAGDNRFYGAAWDFFRLNEHARTDESERSLRCLLDVRNYLENHRPDNGRPWGVVNIVVHTYEWGGLSVPVQEGEGRADVPALRQASASGAFKPLSDGVVDCRTEIRIQGCALGRDSLLLHGLSTTFGGRDRQRPQVSSSRCFVFYGSVREDGAAVAADQFLAEYWYVVYPKGRREGNPALAGRLRDRYPQVGVDWRAALGRKAPRWNGDLYARLYQLPARWLTVYPDSASRPVLTGSRQKREWLEQQAELSAYLGRLDLGFDDFAWTVRDTVVPDSGGRRPAIEAVGRGTVACVLRDVCVPDPARPWLLERAYASEWGSPFQVGETPCRAPARPPGENVPVRVARR